MAATTWTEERRGVRVFPCGTEAIKISDDTADGRGRWNVYSPHGRLTWGACGWGDVVALMCGDRSRDGY